MAAWQEAAGGALFHVVPSRPAYSLFETFTDNVAPCASRQPLCPSTLAHTAAVPSHTLSHAAKRPKPPPLVNPIPVPVVLRRPAVDVCLQVRKAVRLHARHHTARSSSSRASGGAATCSNTPHTYQMRVSEVLACQQVNNVSIKVT